MPGGHGCGDQALAGVGDAGHAGVGHQRDALAPDKPGQHSGDLADLGVLVDHDERPALDAGQGQQLAGAARVLAAHRVGRGQRLGSPGAEVAEVADGGAHQHQRARLGHGPSP
jgi:hypothetical protein